MTPPGDRRRGIARRAVDRHGVGRWDDRGATVVTPPHRPHGSVIGGLGRARKGKRYKARGDALRRPTRWSERSCTGNRADTWVREWLPAPLRIASTA